MDTGRLVAVVNRLIGEDEQLSIQPLLQAVLVGLSNLAANPNDSNTQLNARNALLALNEAVDRLSYQSDPTFGKYVDALKGTKFFSESLLTEISEAMISNTMTPAVARDVVQKLFTERQSFLEFLKTFSISARGLNISSDDVKEGESQIGFRIPRQIFGNELKGWTIELNELRRIIGPFSELATGGAEPIQIGEISTTDPIIFLILRSATVALIAKAVSWSLDQWKKIEEIRKLRAETSKLSEASHGSMDKLVADFDGIIKSTLTAAIDDYALVLIPDDKKAGRTHELRTWLLIALESLMGRIERGMTIELKFLPPTSNEEGDKKIKAEIEVIRLVVPQLVFPSPSQTPVTSLPKIETEDHSHDKTKNKGKS